VPSLAVLRWSDRAELAPGGGVVVGDLRGVPRHAVARADRRERPALGIGEQAGGGQHLARRDPDQLVDHRGDRQLGRAQLAGGGVEVRQADRLAGASEILVDQEGTDLSVGRRLARPSRSIHPSARRVARMIVGARRIRPRPHRGRRGPARRGIAGPRGAAGSGLARLAGSRAPRTRLGRPRARRRRLRARHQRGEVARQLGLEDIVVEHDARRHDPHDLALDQALGELGILDLLDEDDLVAELGELGDVDPRRVVRHAAHRHRIVLALVARGQREIEQPRADHRVLEEHLVEVTEPEQHQPIRMPLLDVQVLPHQRRLGGVPGGHARAISRRSDTAPAARRARRARR
jgi:hypothetical protein